jgi:hypothetical protein
MMKEKETEQSDRAQKRQILQGLSTVSPAVAPFTGTLFALLSNYLIAKDAEAEQQELNRNIQAQIRDFGQVLSQVAERIGVQPGHLESSLCSPHKALVAEEALRTSLTLASNDQREILASILLERLRSDRAEKDKEPKDSLLESSLQSLRYLDGDSLRAMAFILFFRHLSLEERTGLCQQVPSLIDRLNWSALRREHLLSLGCVYSSGAEYIESPKRFATHWLPQSRLSDAQLRILEGCIGKEGGMLHLRLTGSGQAIAIEVCRVELKGFAKTIDQQLA